MAEQNKENKGKISLNPGKKLTLSGGSMLKIDKARILEKISSGGSSSASSGIIVRKGENADEYRSHQEDSTSDLSESERRRRFKALEEDAKKVPEPAPVKKPKMKQVSVEEAALESGMDFDLQAPMKDLELGQTIDAKALEEIKIDVREKSKQGPESNKPAEDAPSLFVFKQSDTPSVTIPEIAPPSEEKVDKRDRRVIDKILSNYKYLEFDSNDEIADLEKGIELRHTLESRRKGDSDDEIDVLTTSPDVVDEQTVKVRREAFFSRHNRKARRSGGNTHAFIKKEIDVYDSNKVLELARTAGVKIEQVLRTLKNLGLNAKEGDTIDGDWAELLIEELGHFVRRIKAKTAEDKIDKTVNDSRLKPMNPVVTIMGHVDHGKTSLLDALRHANVADGESGGITQHIGAYQTVLPGGQKITFIDTPGHEAFSAIRSRGANVTDIVVLVVAADDGVMPQTVEAIEHAKAANVPIVVAINKIDKPGANPQKVKNELLAHGIVSEDLGGDVIFAEVSAKNRTNLDKLCEAIMLQAEVLDLKADYTAHASGVVLESKIDKQKGVITTFLVQNGTLKIGDIILADLTYGRVRLMVSYSGESVKEAEPAEPVEVYGLDSVPAPGSKFYVVENEKVAREVVAHRKAKKTELEEKPKTQFSKVDLDALFKAKAVSKKAVSLIIRADVQSSVEAIKYSLDKIKSDEVDVKIMQIGVGSITEADINAAKNYKAHLVSFNVKIGTKEEELARRGGIPLKHYSIIYQLIDDVKALVSAQLAPKITEEIVGEAEVRMVFEISKAGKIAGSIVKKGVAKRNAIVKIIRDGQAIFEGKLRTLKHFKEDVKELAQGNECGIQVEGFDGFKSGDIIQIIERTEEKRSL